jgi:ferric-dicitrate binding protein FerR (iron transport regulator)
MNNMEEDYKLAKWLAGGMTESERKAFQETPEYATYIKIAHYSTQLKTPVFDEDLMLQNIVSSKKSTPKGIPFYQSKWLRIAAVLVVFLGLTFVLKSEITFTEYAENAKKTTFILPDQSEIVLNSGSEITYKKWKWNNQRSLKLKGEAFFKVAKGKTFDVQTDLGTVTVVGTQFSVKSRGNRMEVYCYEGKVRVQNKSQITYLTEGKHVYYENNKQIVTSFSDSIPLWLQNRITFESEDLAAISAEMERQYGVKISVKNVPLEQQFTGTIPSNDLDVALEIICKTFQLKATKTKATIILEGK